MENKTTDKKKSSVLFVLLKVVLTVVGAGAAFFVMMISDLLLSGADIHRYVSVAVTCIVPFGLLPVIWVKNRKKFMKLWLLVTVVCGIAVGVNYAVVKYDDSLKVDTTYYRNIEDIVNEFGPFDEDSRVVKGKSKTLQLTENLPELDSTIAFHPLYSSFIHAVYPESDELYYGSFDSTQSWGYRELAEKTADIFLNLEYPNEEQKDFAASRGVTYEFTTIGTEAFVFIVDRDNPIDNLTTDQLQGIYSGEITNWSQVGGQNKKIVAYQNEAGTSGQNMMERFMGEVPLMAAPTEMGYGNLYGWEEMISVYRNKPASIGFAFNYCVKDYEDIKILSVDGVAPTRENIENGSYRVVAPVMAITYEGNTNENVDKLVDWMLSDEGQHIVREIGYFGIVSEYLN